MEEKKEAEAITETKQTKKPRGWPKGKPRGPRKKVQAKPKPQTEPAPEQSVVNIDISREQLLAETILEAKGYTEEELDDILLGSENIEPYDWARQMDETRLPEPLQKLVDDKKQAFRWIDSSDQTCMTQITRDKFRWTPVNLLTHGKYFKEREKRIRFNKHGGIMFGYMLLCWMPWRLYEKWRELKGKMAAFESPADRTSKTPGVDMYDPVAEGTAARAADTPATDKQFSGVVHVANDRHPDSPYEEQGEYT